VKSYSVGTLLSFGAIVGTDFGGGVTVVVVRTVLVVAAWNVTVVGWGMPRKMLQYSVANIPAPANASAAGSALHEKGGVVLDVGVAVIITVDVTSTVVVLVVEASAGGIERQLQADDCWAEL
jgi:hypothetical protein